MKSFVHNDYRTMYYQIVLSNKTHINVKTSEGCFKSIACWSLKIDRSGRGGGCHVIPDTNPRGWVFLGCHVVESDLTLLGGVSRFSVKNVTLLVGVKILCHIFRQKCHVIDRFFENLGVVFCRNVTL